MTSITGPWSSTLSAMHTPIYADDEVFVDISTPLSEAIRVAQGDDLVYITENGQLVGAVTTLAVARVGIAALTALEELP